MYKVLFCGFAPNSVSSVIFEAPVVEAAVAFALDLHRLSNVPHSVSVYDSDEAEVVIFTKVDKSTDAGKK